MSRLEERRQRERHKTTNETEFVYQNLKTFTAVGEEKLMINTEWLKERKHSEMVTRQGSPDLGSSKEPGQWEGAEHDIFGAAGGQIMPGAMQGLARTAINSSAGRMFP